MKIFVTVGFECYPFDRLLQAIDAGVKARVMIAGEVFIQTGYSRYRAGGCDSDRFLAFDRVVSRLREADIVISHAGVGTTLLCLTLGKTPVLFPRQSRYGEHVDDHQVRFAQKIESQGQALVAYEEADLLDKVTRYSELVNGNRLSGRVENSQPLKRSLEEILAAVAAKKGTGK